MHVFQRISMELDNACNTQIAIMCTHIAEYKMTSSMVNVEKHVLGNTWVYNMPIII